MREELQPYRLTNELADELICRFTGPAYVFSAPEFAKSAQLLKKSLPAAKICFSIKANPFMSATATEVCDLLEVCSPGELEICIANEVDPEQILYSGVCKGAADIERALRYGVRLFTAESPLQYQLLASACSSLNIAIDLLLRLEAQSQFGMNKQALEALLAQRETQPLLNIIGLHYFRGTQRQKSSRHLRELEKLVSYIDELEARFDWQCAWLEYGAGLGIEYFDQAKLDKDFEVFFELAPRFEELSSRFTLGLEFGRFLAADCGSYLAHIVDLKEGSEGAQPYAFIDGGIHHLNYLGSVMGLKCPPISVIHKSPAPESRNWVLAGSLCTTNDILSRDFAAALSLGDVLIFHKAGAYSMTESMGLFLSRDLPAVLLIDLDGNVQELRCPRPTWTFNCNQKKG